MARTLTNVSRRTTAELCAGRVPALQRCGLVRTTCGHKQFRDNLLEF